MRRALLILVLVSPALAQDPAPVAPIASPTPAQARKIARRTAEVERALRPIVETWYADREPGDYTCPQHKAPSCPNCTPTGMSRAAGAKAWTDLLSPRGRELAHEPPAAGELPLFERVLRKEALVEQIGREMLVTSAVWIGVRLEERVAVARARVTWYAANAPESEHESRWVLVRGRFYLAADGELGDMLLPR